MLFRKHYHLSREWAYHNLDWWEFDALRDGAYDLSGIQPSAAPIDGAMLQAP